MTDTQWPVFEVFHQQARGEPHIHVGSIHAPDAEAALILAKEQYARRLACVNLWVVPAGAITASSYEDSDIFERATDKSYRESWGYKAAKHVKVTEPALKEATKPRGHEATKGGHGGSQDLP